MKERAKVQALKASLVCGDRKLSRRVIIVIVTLLTGHFIPCCTSSQFFSAAGKLFQTCVLAATCHVAFAAGYGNESDTDF